MNAPLLALLIASTLQTVPPASGVAAVAPTPVPAAPITPDAPGTAAPVAPVAAPKPSGTAASTGLHQCIGPDGSSIFTDRQCVDLQATTVAPSASIPGQAASVVRTRTCARSQDDLLFAVRMALESRDPNRLADYYHWSGMGTAEGYRVAGRLDGFAKRLLLDVQLVTHAEVERAAADRAIAVQDPITAMAVPSIVREGGASGSADSGLDGTPAASPPPTPAELLRVDQQISESDTGSQVTYFRLRKNAGCWWLQF